MHGHMSVEFPITRSLLTQTSGEKKGALGLSIQRWPRCNVRSSNVFKGRTI